MHRGMGLEMDGTLKPVCGKKNLHPVRPLSGCLARKGFRSYITIAFNSADGAHLASLALAMRRTAVPPTLHHRSCVFLLGRAGPRFEADAENACGSGDCFGIGVSGGLKPRRKGWAEDGEEGSATEGADNGRGSGGPQQKRAEGGESARAPPPAPGP